MARVNNLNIDIDVDDDCKKSVSAYSYGRSQCGFTLRDTADSNQYAACLVFFNFRGGLSAMNRFFAYISNEVAKAEEERARKEEETRRKEMGAKA